MAYSGSSLRMGIRKRYTADDWPLGTGRADRVSDELLAVIVTCDGGRTLNVSLNLPMEISICEMSLVVVVR